MTTSQTRTWLELRGGDYDGQYHATWPAIEIVAFVTLALTEQATGGDGRHDSDRLFPDAPRRGRRDGRGNERAPGLLPVSFSGSK